jgi:hypothetical protein
MSELCATVCEHGELWDRGNAHMFVTLRAPGPQLTAAPRSTLASSRPPRRSRPLRSQTCAVLLLCCSVGAAVCVSLSHSLPGNQTEQQVHCMDTGTGRSGSGPASEAGECLHKAKCYSWSPAGSLQAGQPPITPAGGTCACAPASQPAGMQAHSTPAAGTWSISSACHQPRRWRIACSWPLLPAALP